MAISTSNRKILVVDDEVSIVELISEILHRRNYHPIGAVKWTEALDAINNESPDLILLDLKMPTIHGSSMLEFIREEGVDTPVIVVSGFITEEVSQELSGIGVSGFIGKPFQASQLIAEIERVLGKPETPEVLPADAPPERQPSEQPSSRDALAQKGERADNALSTDGLEYEAGAETVSSMKEAADDFSLEDTSSNYATMDALYRSSDERPRSPEGTADAQSTQAWLPEDGETPGMDILYRLSAGDALTAESLPNAPPADEEVLQILQRRNAAGHERPTLAKSDAAETGATTEGNGDDQAAKEVLRALGKLDGEKQAAKPDQTQTTGPIAGAAREPGASPGALSSRPSMPPSLTRPSPASGPGGSPGASGSPSPSPLSGPAQQELYPEKQRSSGHHRSSRRPRGSGNNMIYVVLTVICVLVAGGMVAFKMLASYASKTFDEKAAAFEKSVVEQAKKEAVKEVGKDLRKGP